ncbi:hypothetical protein AB0J72_12990 [Dactylosporangium sp. NPDC049742]|uniref:hypothetical protein n=1 Tax=Dactylosporangium sp. NPDC049742 TaxID=3154737 RepID=UPI003428C95C
MAIGVAAVLIVVSGLAAWNPWNFVRLGHGGYWFAGAVTLTPLTGGVVAVLIIRNRAAAIAVGVVSAVLTLVVAAGGAFLALFTDPEWDRTVLASSPSGTYQVVSLEDLSLTSRRFIRVSRPAGILTRDSTRPLVCIESGFGDTPNITVKSARFVTEHEVEVTLQDGKTWQTQFDPDDLQPAQTLKDGC